MENLTDLLQKVQAGKLESDELAYVVKRIKASKPGDDQDLYTLIDILGKAQAKEYRSLVESFLDYPSDPQIPKIALETLCLSWGLIKEYIPTLKHIIRSLKDYDFSRKDEPVRLVALKCAGEFLRDYPEPELLELLLSIQDRRNREQEIIQYGAYAAIIRAIGKDWSDIPKFEDINLETGLKRDYPFIYKAREMLKKQCAEQGIMRSIDELYKEASDGEFDDETTLTEEEIDYVAHQLENSNHKTGIWKLLDILVYTKAIKYRSLIEKYLYYPDFPLISRIALKGLCDWGYTKDYLDVIKAFLKGVEWDHLDGWDDEDRICSTASWCLADFLKDELKKDPHSKESRELLQFLIDLYRNGKDNTARGFAFRTLSVATGINRSELKNPKSSYYIYNLVNKYDLNI